MSLFTGISSVITLAAILSYLNYKWLKLPSTIGVMVLSLLIGISLKIADLMYPESISAIKNEIFRFDFSNFVLNIILCFLLFAGAMHVKLSALKEVWTTVFFFALFGTLISTFLIAALSYGALALAGYQVDFIICLLFGALISPTDPIAVIGILSKYKVPQKLKTEIMGESLFNDGVGVVLFSVILNMYTNGMDTFSAGEVVKLLLEEVGGGVLIGFAFGFAGYWLMRSIDHYQTEVLITLSMVMGGYSMAAFFHASGPLAMVIAGLLIGNIGRRSAVSDLTAEYLDKFWELVDETCNIILFMIMGIEIFIVQFQYSFILLGLLFIVITLFARFVSLLPPHLIFNRNAPQKMLRIATLTWGGLRGGISIALMLSLHGSIPFGEMFVFITYTVVFFSIIVQGLTIQKLLRKF